MIKLAFAVLAAVAGIASVHAEDFEARPPRAIIVPFDNVAMSQTEDTTPIALNSAACGDQHDNLYTRENHYWRRFYLSEYPGIGTYVRFLSVDVGVERTNGMTITVNLYATPDALAPETIDRAQLVFLGNGTVAVPAGTALTSVNVPTRGSLSDTTGTDLVVEVVTPDGSTNSQTFFIGSTTAPESHASFFSSLFCEQPEPVPTADIGYPNMHIIMTVNTGGDALFSDGFDGP